MGENNGLNQLSELNNAVHIIRMQFLIVRNVPWA